MNSFGQDFWFETGMMLHTPFHSGDRQFQDRAWYQVQMTAVGFSGIKRWIVKNSFFGSDVSFHSAMTCQMIGRNIEQDHTAW